jgi:hypothetical protein
MVCLGEVLARAAGNARVELAKDSTMEQHLKDTIDGIASLLPRLGSTIQGELRSAETVTESKYWDNLQDRWREEVDSLHDTFEKASSAAIMEKSGNCKGTS